ncbi:type IV toxin-antitoxin system AbiEi family antitoxin domain-containing protein [[Pseudopropionibacterium] massiliense]|uniref:type IV toxin-antitoxin system AbiEi family antitoxin domain-containing protein n=1 Tax=[Pseudopropionibacterium] massiliense TaxID=2220000 RepID=UPI00103277C0|nr:type IV toxin-antitoxin system AbiEi family antitoxin domain-containing protein [[Pseudopropionibacterium] massiliense]
MKSRVALQQLAEVTESQWGMVTTAQARAQGIDHMTLKRLNDDGHLARLIHGVYRSTGAPTAEHEELRAAWLATEPRRLALERLRDDRPGIVVSGESAAQLHGIGDLRATRSEFTSPTRRQSQRLDVRYRTRDLPREDITVRDGLPATTRERTIADLVEDRQDLSTVADALRDATRQSALDTERLTELLAPLARRNDCAAGDGAALLEKLTRSAGIDENSWAKRIAENGPLMAKILSQHIAHPSPKMQETLEPYSRNPFGRTLTKGFTGGCVACE